MLHWRVQLPWRIGNYQHRDKNTQQHGGIAEGTRLGADSRYVQFSSALSSLWLTSESVDRGSSVLGSNPQSDSLVYSLTWVRLKSWKGRSLHTSKSHWATSSWADMKQPWSPEGDWAGWWFVVHLCVCLAKLVILQLGRALHFYRLPPEAILILLQCIIQLIEASQWGTGHQRWHTTAPAVAIALNGTFNHSVSLACRDWAPMDRDP